LTVTLALALLAFTAEAAPVVAVGSENVVAEIFSITVPQPKPPLEAWYRPETQTLVGSLGSMAVPR
jgi:hypothetical protein